MYGLDLFSGIGGISLALQEWVRPICYVEIDPYAQSVLKTRFKSSGLFEAPIWDDVRTFDGRPLEGLVDIIYGGFPCQDLSRAGKREGLGGKRSGLFFEVIRLAKEVKPVFIFLENVPGIRTKGLATVGEQLADIGYDCRWGPLSAYDVGAPHKRERWFCLAYSKCIGIHKQPRRSSGKGRKSKVQPVGDGAKRVVANTCKPGLPNSCTWWSTEPDVGRVANGIPFRVDRIKCLGNAVVPAQVSEAFKRLIGFIK